MLPQERDSLDVTELQYMPTFCAHFKSLNQQNTCPLPNAYLKVSDYQFKSGAKAIRNCFSLASYVKRFPNCVKMCHRQKPNAKPGKKCRSEGTQACLQSFGLCLRHIFTRAVKQSSVRSECKTKPRDFFLAFDPGFVNFLLMNWEMSAADAEMRSGDFRH